MRTVHAVGIAVLAGAIACAGACSSSSASPAADSGAPDAASDVAFDAPLGPMVCSIPVATSCPLTAPCTFASWGCPEAAACQGYFVVSDGTWVYYYSSSGGELVGEVPLAIANGTSDGGLVECPYGFEFPPTSMCAPAVPSACNHDASTPEASVPPDAGRDASANGDAGLAADAPSDAPTDSPDDGG